MTEGLLEGIRQFLHSLAIDGRFRFAFKQEKAQWIATELSSEFIDAALHQSAEVEEFEQLVASGQFDKRSTTDIMKLRACRHSNVLDDHVNAHLQGLKKEWIAAGIQPW